MGGARPLPAARPVAALGKRAAPALGARHAALCPEDRVRRPALRRLAVAGRAPERAGGARGGGGADRAGGAGGHRRRADRRRRARAGAGGARRPRARLGAVPAARGAERAPAPGAGRGGGGGARWRTTSTPASTRSSASYLFRLVARRAPLVHDRGLAWRVGHRARPRGDARGRRRRWSGGTTSPPSARRSARRRARCGRSTRSRSRRSRAPAGREYRFRLRARSFLHNQVRGIVGTLERVGAGAWPPERVAEALAARDRAACGPVARRTGCTCGGALRHHRPRPADRPSAAADRPRPLRLGAQLGRHRQAPGAGRQVIAVDLRNHGDSPREPASTAIAAMAGDLAETIAAHGGRADVLGHSMGGKAAMVLALTEPGRVDRLDRRRHRPGRLRPQPARAMSAPCRRSTSRGRHPPRRRPTPRSPPRVPEPALRAFLLQSLAIDDGRATLEAEPRRRSPTRCRAIMAFPDLARRLRRSRRSS